MNGWLSLPLTLPRRVIDEGGSLVDAVLELPALLRSLGESLATMDQQVRGAASAVANIEDELQGVLRSVEPLDTRLQAVIEAVEPLEDEIGAVRAHVDPLSGQLDALERRLGSLEGHMDAMAGSITELHGDLRKIPGIWSPEGGTTVTDTIADLTARVDFQATGDPALSDAADSTEVSLLGYGELYSLWERQQWSCGSRGRPCSRRRSRSSRRSCRGVRARARRQTSPSSASTARSCAPTTTRAGGWWPEPGSPRRASCSSVSRSAHLGSSRPARPSRCSPR